MRACILLHFFCPAFSKMVSVFKKSITFIALKCTESLM